MTRVARPLTEDEKREVRASVRLLVLDEDSTRNAAADRVVEAEVSGLRCRGLVQGWDALVEAAGPALANRYCFALVHDPHSHGSMNAWITPLQEFRERECVDCRSGSPVDRLIPECCEVMESLYSFKGSHGTTALLAGEYLHGRGLVWDAEFQDFMDDCGASMDEDDDETTSDSSGESLSDSGSVTSTQ